MEAWLDPEVAEVADESDCSDRFPNEARPVARSPPGTPPSRSCGRLGVVTGGAGFDARVSVWPQPNPTGLPICTPPHDHGHAIITGQLRGRLEFVAAALKHAHLVNPRPPQPRTLAARACDPGHHHVAFVDNLMVRQAQGNGEGRWRKERA